MAALPHKAHAPAMLAIMLVPLLLGGCHEADTAIDFIIGKKSPAELFAVAGGPMESLFGLTVSAATHSRGRQIDARSPVMQTRNPGNFGNPRLTEDLIVVRSDTLPEVKPNEQQTSPLTTREAKKRAAGMTFDFTFPRDPFMPPSEAVLPTECLPSMPLCRYDYTQLKLRGLIRLADGQYKGMVEDPEGRGFFITPGIQIRGATVTQVTADGVILYIHKTRKVDWLRIEGREAKGY